MKNFYEIFDEFEEAKTKDERVAIIKKYESPGMFQVLQFAFDPNIRWKNLEIPENYGTIDTGPGVSYSKLVGELRRFYIFRENNTEVPLRRSQELLIQILQGLEPREAEVVMGIIRKDLGVPGLTYKFIKSIYPNLLP